MTHADFHPCSEGCGRDSELPGPCEECDMRRRLVVAAADHAAKLGATLVIVENAPGPAAARAFEAAGYSARRPI